MTRRPLTTNLLLTIAALTAGSSIASEPEFDGAISGRELCPQSVCGAAIFVGYYLGTVDGQFAVGFWSAAVNHEEPLPLPNESVEVTGGQWSMKLWILQRFSFRRTAFRGLIQSEGILAANDNNTFDVAANLELDANSGSGIISMTVLLDHNEFPPTVVGGLSAGAE